MAKKENHWGTITDNNDPEKRGRVSVQCPTIASEDVLEWVEPSFHFVDSHASAGAFFVPNIGSLVEVEIESEDDSEVTSLEPKWKCSVYPDGTVPEEFEEHYPERRGWKTKAGHILYFDDTSDDLQFYYHHPSGAELVITHEGDIQLTAAEGKSVLVGSGADEPLVLGNQLKDYFNTALTGIVSKFNTHAHASHGTAPVPAMHMSNMPTSALSTDHKVK